MDQRQELLADLQLAVVDGEQDAGDVARGR
jgi:hypothetical protein